MMLGLLTDVVPAEQNLGIFGVDPWWLIIIKAVAVFAILVLLTLFNIWAERRVVARMQQRVGPNRVGPFGLLQGLVDGIKLGWLNNVLSFSGVNNSSTADLFESLAFRRKVRQTHLLLVDEYIA